MKYCENCRKLLNDNEACTCTGAKLKDVTPQSGIKIANVKGNLRTIVEPALKDKGIPCEFFNGEMDIYNQYNPKVSAETEYSLLVPFEFYSEAFDICVGLGVADPEKKLEVDKGTQASADNKTYEERFEEATGGKRSSFRFLWIVLFIIVACLLIWGIDLIAALIKESMGIPVISKLINLF